ncbi:MAG: hypothetical protein KJ722_06540 [Candidatus Omnitrophica bacterium]|nr:hypothetical protein [Candidatus Omnitrophota bacterium]
MKFTRLVFCLSFLMMFASLSFASEDVIDLGETGFSCSLAIKTNGWSFLTVPKNNLYLNPGNIFYKSRLNKHDGLPEIRHIGFKKNPGVPQGTRIFVFSCYDEESIDLAKRLDFDYGLCIDYKSLSDIEDFKNKAGIKQPVEIANERIVLAFGINSYPALITVKEDELQIQEGF